MMTDPAGEHPLSSAKEATNVELSRSGIARLRQFHEQSSPHQLLLPAILLTFLLIVATTMRIVGAAVGAESRGK